MINDTSEPKFAGLIFTAVYDYTGEMDYSSAILLLQIISMKVNELNLIFWIEKLDTKRIEENNYFWRLVFFFNSERLNI